MLLSVTTFTLKFFVSSFQGIRAVGQVLGYVLSSNMSAIKAKVNVNTKHLAKDHLRSLWYFYAVLEKVLMCMCGPSITNWPTTLSTWLVGDPLPPYNGKPRLFNMRYCPFAQRAALALIAKNIDFEVINVDLMDKPEWLASKSPLTKVPALEISEGLSIYESLVIVEYLDDAYPQRPLLPKDPLQKALDKVLVEACSPLILGLLFKLVKSPDQITDDVVAGYHQALDLLQSHLQQRGTKFLDGAEPGYADYMLWPWFERLIIYDEKKAQIDETKYKLLSEYFANLKEDPVVKQYAVPKEILQSFYEEYGQNKKPNYDQLLEV